MPAEITILRVNNEDKHQYSELVISLLLILNMFNIIMSLILLLLALRIFLLAKIP